MNPILITYTHVCVVDALSDLFNCDNVTAWSSLYIFFFLSISFFETPIEGENTAEMCQLLGNNVLNKL